MFSSISLASLKMLLIVITFDFIKCGHDQTIIFDHFYPIVRDMGHIYTRGSILWKIVNKSNIWI